MTTSTYSDEVDDVRVDGSERRCVDCGEHIDEVWTHGTRRGLSQYPLPIIVCDVCADQREIARGLATWLEVK